MGKADGSQPDDADVVADEDADVEEVGATSSDSVPVGLVLTGRSGWSVGFPALEETPVGTDTDVCVAETVVVATWS